MLASFAIAELIKTGTVLPVSSKARADRPREKGVVVIEHDVKNGFTGSNVDVIDATWFAGDSLLASPGLNKTFLSCNGR